MLLAANRRYLELISAIEDDKAGTDKLNKISQSVQGNDRAYRGFNFFDSDNEQLFRSLPAASSTSAALRTKTSVGAPTAKTAARSHGPRNVFACSSLTLGVRFRLARPQFCESSSFRMNTNISRSRILDSQARDFSASLQTTVRAIFRTLAERE